MLITPVVVLLLSLLGEQEDVVKNVDCKTTATKEKIASKHNIRSNKKISIPSICSRIIPNFLTEIVLLSVYKDNSN